MSSLKFRLCLQAITALNEHDQDALTRSIEQFRAAGMGDQESELAALDDVLAQVQADRAEVNGLLREQHPSLFEQPAPAPQTSPPSLITAPASGALDEKPAAISPAAEPAKAEISEAGENLRYNRRNFAGTGLTWQDILKMEPALQVRETVKGKVWPKPDYQAMIDDGAPPLAVRAIKQVYDGIAAKPAKTDETALQLYVDTLAKLRKVLDDWLADTAAMDALRRDDANPYEVKLLDRLWPEESAKPRYGAYKLGTPAGDEVRALGANRFMRAVQFDRNDFRDWREEIAGGWPASKEAWERQGLSVTQHDKAFTITEGARYLDGAKTPTWVVRTAPGAYVGNFENREAAQATIDNAPPGWIVFDKTGRMVGSAETEDAAKDVARDLVKRKPQEGAGDTGYALGEANRVGPDRRPAGTDVSAQDLMDTFGLRGVNFGRKGYIGNELRQAYLNAAYDGLMDLADLLNLPPKALSLNGQLGLAFGAQGRGGRAAAHFVPGVNEINLTRDAGAGTIAHEWAHALDHYFGVMAGLARDKDPFLSAHAALPDTKPKFEGPRKIGSESRFAEELRPEILTAFKAIESAMNKRGVTQAMRSAQNALATSRATEGLDKWLSHMGRGMKSPEAKAEFDALADKLRAGDVGDGYVRIGRMSPLRKTVGDIAALVKAKGDKVAGVDLPDNWKGLDSAASHLAYVKNRNDAADEHIPQGTTRSIYAAESGASDKSKGGKAYWGTEWEKFARAFETWVSDALQAREQANTFLSDGGRRADDTSDKRMPYPRGEERAAIGRSFEELIGQFKTRTDDAGKTVLFGRTLVNPDLAADNRPTLDHTQPEMQTAKGAAQWLAKNATEPWMREIAAAVLPGIDADAQIKYLEVGKNYRLPTAVAEVMRAGTFGVSQVDPLTGDNTLFMKWGADRPVRQEDMLHELLHGGTQRALLSPKSAAARQELESIRRELLANLRAVRDTDVIAKESRDTADFFSRVIVNEDELLAYGLTSPTFREWTQNITSSGAFAGQKEDQTTAGRMFDRAQPKPGLTLWQRFVDVVRSLLGLSKLYAPRLERLLRQRERQRIAFITKNTEPTLAKRLDELLREVVQVQRRTSKEEYVAQWTPSANIRQGVNVLSGLRGFDQTAARNLLLDLMGEAGGIGTWAKTVGTQYAKAKQHPSTFGRVFDAVQDYIKDINVFANTAADQAPSILPKLEHWTDLKKSGAEPEDMKAAGAAIWKGTLEDKRVYKADELRKMGLNGTQIGLYKEFRAAVDQSLDDLARTEIMRLAGNDGLPVSAAVMGSRSLREAATVMIDHLTELHAKTLRRDLLLAIEQINDKAVKVEKLKDEGYAPLMRFGRHTLHIIDKKGATLFFGMYESAFEANRARRELEADPEFKDANFIRGKASQEAYRLFSGMPLDALELFAEATGNEDNAIYQEYLKLTKSNRSALKRMIHRQGIAGFNEDATRVLASFVTSNARLASGNMHLGRARSAANAMPPGDLKDEATKLVLYVQDPQEEASAVRGLLFTNFIGGSVASAAVNLTQPFTMSLPYLSQFGGVANAGRHLLAALRQVNSPQGEIAEALKRAEDDGIVSPQEIHHLRAEAMSRLGNHPFLKKAAFVWGSMFSLSEQFNRRLTFIAAYNTAKQNGVEDPFAFAEKAVIETQGLYNKGNKPNWARGAIGATVFTFKQYSIHYLEFLKRMWDSGPEGKKAVGVAIAILLLTAGASGLPFADDLDDAIDTLAQALGYDFSSKKAKRAFIAETLGLGQLAGEVATRGLSAIPGFPIDVSLRMGLGNLLPGTGALLRSNTDRAKDVLEFAGAAGSLAKSAMDSGNKMLSGAPVDAMLGVAPIAIQNIAKAMQMWNTGEYRNTRGQKVMNTDAVDAVMKGIGFQPAQIARESAAMGEVQRSVQLAKNVEGQIAEKWAQGLNDGDQAKVADARAELRAWNEKNDAQMRITMQQVIQRVRQMRMTREQRAVRSAPREMRPAVEEAFRQ